MEKVKIPGRQIQAMLALFLLGSSFVSGGVSKAQQDSWICLIAAYVLSIPLLWVYSRFLELYDSRNFFDCILQSCGKIAGTAVCALYALFSLHVIALVLRIFTEYMHNLSLTETPLAFIAGCIVVTVVYALRSRFSVLARISRPLLAVYIFLLVLTVLLAQRNMDPANLKPFLHHTFANMAEGTLTPFTVPFGETVLFLPALSSLERGEKTFPVLLKGSAIGFVFLLIVNLRNLLILGYSDSTYMFPSYNAASVISIGDFILGVEVIVGVYVLIAGFVRLCVLLYTTGTAFAAVFRFQDYEPLVIPCGVLAITMTLLVHRDTADLFSFLSYYPAYALPIQTVLPILLLAVGKIRRKIGPLKKSRRKTPQNAPAP